MVSGYMQLSGGDRAVTSVSAGGAGGSAAVIVAASDSLQSVKDVADYVCDGTADEVQINAALGAIPTEGGVVTLAPGTFNLTATIDLSETGTGGSEVGTKKVLLSGYGAEITTSGAIWALTVSNMGNPDHPSTIEGLHIKQGDNTTAVGGILIQGSWNTRVRDVTIDASGASGAYSAAVQVQRDADGDGSFWTNIENVWIRKGAGAAGTIPIGINLIGDSNATRILNCGINSCTQGIVMGPQTSYSANIDIDSVLIQGVAFESVTDAITIDGPITGVYNGNGSGIIIMGCRSESVTNFLTLSNRSGVGYTQPPFLSGNFISASTTNYVTISGQTGDATQYTSFDYREGVAPLINPVMGSAVIGRGLETPDGVLHVHEASAGAVTANSQARQLVVETDQSQAGLSVLTPNTGVGSVVFGDPDDNNVGRVQYSHTDDEMTFVVNDSTVVLLETDGTLGLGTTAPDASRAHIVTTALAAAATTNTDADDLVIENNENTGITIKAPATGNGYLMFGDSVSNNPGYIRYSHSDDTLRVRVSGSEKLTVSSTLISTANGVFVQEAVTSAITASTNQTQGQGALTNQINEVATVANANDTVTLPTAVAGVRVTIINNGANTLQIFPASGDNLGAGVDTATTLAAGSNVTYVAYDATNWESV